MREKRKSKQTHGSKDREITHSLLSWPKQTWLSELKTCNYQFGYWEPKKRNFVNTLGNPLFSPFHKLSITPAPLLLTSMSPPPYCHSTLHPVPLVKQKAAQGLRVMTEWLLSAVPRFPRIFSALAERTNLMLLCCVHFT